MVGAAGSAIDVANVFKLGVSRGELQIIGTTTPSQYRRYIDTDAARDWSFQPVQIRESSQEEAEAILKGVKPRYEKHHDLLITDEVVNVAVHLAARYVTDRSLPGKAIDLIDEAGSRAYMNLFSSAGEQHEVFVELRKVKKLKEEALAMQRFEDAIELRYRERELEMKSRELYAAHKEAAEPPAVTMEDIAETVSLWTGLPADRIIEEERARRQGRDRLA